MKKTVRVRSALPLFGTAAVCLLWCLFLPLYKMWHFAALIGALAVTFALLEKFFPGHEEEVAVPEPEPEPTGDETVDALVREGRQAVSELRRLRNTVREPSVRARVDEIADLTEKIFADVVEDPQDAPQIRRFANYYLPTTMKLLYAYDRMSERGSGDNVTGTLRRIEDILDTTVAAYKKQYDALFANEALDIETDITVLESMLKREGLTGRDFEV